MSWQLDKIGFGGDGGVKKTQKTSDIINGCSLKPTNSWTPLSKMSTKRCWQCQCSSEGQVVACPGRLWMVTTDLPLVNMYLQMEMHPQHSGQDLADGSISSSSSIGHHHTPPWHRRHLTNGTATLDILTEVVFGCATFNSPMHDNREVVLAVGGYDQATAQVLDYSQPNPAWTTSNYYSFIWLFYLTVLHYSWNGTTFCLKTMLSFILHPRDWCESRSF